MHTNGSPEDEKIPSNTPSPSPTPSGDPRVQRIQRIARNTLLTLWGVFTVQGIVADKDFLKFDFLQADWKRMHLGGHMLFPDGGVRGIFEPAYLSVGAPEELVQTVAFNSPQIYARKFDVGASIDHTDHERLTSMIREWLATYIMSSIYGETFLENAYLRDVDQRSFQYRIKRIRFHASSSPEAMLHGLMSIMINKVDQENVELAHIRLAKFKAALEDACRQLHIELPAESENESAVETQLNHDEEQTLLHLAGTYPGGGEKLLTDYQLYCEQMQRGVAQPQTDIPQQTLKILDAIIGSKRTVWCEAEFVTDKGHVFLIPIYWLGFFLLLPLLRKLIKRIKQHNPGDTDPHGPKPFPKKFRLPRYTSDLVHTSYVKNRSDQAMIKRLVDYQFAQERLMNETIGVQIVGHRSAKKVSLDFSLLDPMHYGNLSVGTFDPSIYLVGLDLPPLVKARIEYDAQHGRAFNVLLYTLVMLQNYHVPLPSQEIVMGWIHSFYLRYAEIPPFDPNEIIEIPQLVVQDAEGVHDLDAIGPVDTVEDVFAWTDAGDAELFAVTEGERRKSFSSQKHKKSTMKTRARLRGVLQMSAVDLHDIATNVVEKNKQIYAPSKTGRPGRDVRTYQHDQQYNHLRSANQGKGRTGRPKYGRTGVGTRDVHSKARSSKKMRHQPPAKK